MSNYVVVTNYPNHIATVHKAGCSALQSHPDVTSSSERHRFDDGFVALSHAQQSMPSDYGLCGHCLRDTAQTMADARR